MGHVRINEREANPNPHINFITVLPVRDATAEDEARQLLRALAAQVKPVMKAHGFVVNSLEEYEFNHVFSGRNWNNGETIELVLRNANGSMQPVHWLMSTLCHELAHIKHMNHGTAFQVLWRQLRQEVLALQNRGYHGDGYWSSGRRLADSARVAGQGIEVGDLPEYMCGGAHSRVRPASLRRGPRTAAVAGPSSHTGAQTIKKRKAGSRVTTADAFPSAGRALNDNLDEDVKAVGSRFRKKAGSKRAREERALAAENRIQAVQEGRHVETDQDRRQVLLESVDQQDLNSLKSRNYDFSDDFLRPSDTHTAEGPGSSSSVEQSSAAVMSRKRLRTGTPAPSSRKRERTLHFGNPSSSVPVSRAKQGSDNMWGCLVCTLANQPNHLACSTCSTPRGDSEWVGTGVEHNPLVLTNDTTLDLSR
ncbi:hypothetical protein SCLCIDRAFT_882192 [Scleroderma citrinum Foug A]|uniref:WLM domain-containing protein n=1 Tax=Scleroderma citrinum Foug A TaxID=1036808 RepID=A0A0C3E710_9AGAM|nr:hypothetical protein SCLCIDRAFT_882192 [Scleroderma citrinum Foug A]